MIDAQYPSVNGTEQTSTAPKKRIAAQWAFVLRSVFLIVVSTLLLGFAVFTLNITRMVQPLSVSTADGIVVLTGGTDRLKPAIELLKKGLGKKLLISGVNPSSTKASVVRPFDVDPALAKCCIDLDQVATNTIGNAAQSAKWIAANGFDSVILVTSNYHMPRAQKELSRLVGRTKITPFPVVNSDLTNWKWVDRPEAFRLILTEYLKTIVVFGRHLFSKTPQQSDFAKISG